MNKNNYKIYIYGLYDSSDALKTIRYVGQTKNINKRMIKHRCYNCLPKSYRRSWIKSVLDAKNEIQYIVLEECTLVNWIEREKYWIKFYNENGNKLTNGTIGGDGHQVHYITYEDCKKWNKNNIPHIKSIKEWNENLKNLPSFIPHAPRVVFIENGWISWIDFLDSKNIYPQDLTKCYINYDEAKKWVENNLQNIKSSRQWQNAYRNNLIPNFIPNIPYKFYKHRGWKGWGDFLRTGLMQPSVKSKNYLSMEDFAKWVNKNFPKLMNGKDWEDNYVKKGKIPNFLPTNPKQYYGSKKQWLGWIKILPNFKYATTYNKIIKQV